MSTENATPKSSPFMSMFGRKKRGVNGTKSADDIKGAAAALAINNGQTTGVGNGFIDADMDSIKDLSISNGAPPVAAPRTIDSARHPIVAPSNSSFVEKVRYHKSSRTKHSREADGTHSTAVPSQSSTLPTRARDDCRRLSSQQKARSADAVCMSDDPNYLMEALETLAEEQPLVARSIPKHAVVDTSEFRERSLDNCLFDASVYDNMLCDSLKVCELLQNHLSECIVTVRAKSPDVRRLGCVDEGSDEEETETSLAESSQRTIIESPRASVDPKRLSTLTNGTTASSIESHQAAPLVDGNRKLKSIVQYQC